MTINNSASRVVCLGNGTTTQFSFSFLIPASGDEYIVYTDASGNVTPLANTLYTVVGFGNASGGTVIYPLVGSPIASGTTLTIARIVPLIQPVSISNQGAFYPQVVEEALDYLTMEVQQVSQAVSLAIAAPISDNIILKALPPAAQRANQILAFDSQGQPTTAAQGGPLVNVIPATNGGTGYSTYTPGDMLYADTTSTLAKISGTTSYGRSLLTVPGVTGTGKGVLANNPALTAPSLVGATSGQTVLASTAIASGTLTLPAATDTLVGRATTDTLTNKTFDTAATGNSLLINGLAATANVGTGAIVRQTYADTKLPVFNIASYGASPGASASTNDTAIAAAIAAASAAGGGRVYVPTGTFMHNLTITMANGVVLAGDGDFSVLKSNTLVDIGIGHIQVDCSGKSFWAIHDICLDASGVTPFTTGMRSINCNLATHDYVVERVLFKTPGAAIASIGSYNYRVSDNWIYCMSTDGVSHHDGVIDNWYGSHDFDIINNKIIGGGIGRYGVLVTGETSTATAAACYNFRIHNNDISAFLLLGIWTNGRSGINNHFSICNNRVDTVSQFHGIGVADCDYGIVDGNLINNVAYVGLFLYSEGGHGVTGCRQVTAINNIITNVNQLALGNPYTGSAIALLAPSTGCSIDNNRVNGTAQTYSLYVDNSTTSCVFGDGNNFDAGTSGTISYGTSTTNTIPATTGANTFSALQTISIPAAGTALTVISNASGATAGPSIDCYRNSPSPGAFNQGFTLYASFNNSSAVRTTFGYIQHVAQAVTAGSESGAWDFQTRRAGTMASRMILQNGLYTSNATGGDKGNDTINAGVGFYLNGNLVISSAGILSNVATAGVGYATGAGGPVTQATSKSTGVTLNKPCGQITMNAAALAAGAKVSFVITNSAIVATDTIVTGVASGGTANAYRTSVTATAAGSFTITVENITAGSLSESPIINFAAIKAVNS